MINDSQQLTRQIMGNVPTWLAISFYAAATLALLWTAIALWKRVQLYRGGVRQRTTSMVGGQNSSWMYRAWGVLRHATFHRQLARDRFAGVAHLLVFYGFVVLFIGTCLVFLEYDTPLHFFYGRFYLVASLVIDVGGGVFLVGLAMFLYRRHAGNSSRILRRPFVAALAWLLLAIGVSGFVLEGARIAVDRPKFERWSVFGYTIAFGLNLLGVRGESALMLHRATWGLHAAMCVAFFALLPWGFFSHIVFGPVSWVLRSQRPRAALRTRPLDAVDTPPGAMSWRDFEWIDLLQADACTTCGRCNAVCPANAAGKPLQPRDVVLGIREAMHSQNGANGNATDDLAHLIDDDVIWSCTTCNACNEACPVGIEVFDKIVSLRQGRVEAGAVPKSAISRFESTADEFNPFKQPRANRMDWAAGLDVPIAETSQAIELLYWVGCAGSFDPEGRGVSRAMVKILNHLGISYHVLGKRERCTGDPVRRMGEEGLFQELAAHNVDVFNQHGVVRVLTHCPHCFNTFRNEYPQLHNIDITVEHHSEFLQRMVYEGKLQLTSHLTKTVTFHDPCYLGRGNGQTSAPRATLAAVRSLDHVEMPRHGTNSFCCGAGGGSLWLDVAGTDRVENQRAAEAAGTGADAVVTGCPFCKGMLEAGRQSLDDSRLQVLDLAELIVQAEGL